MKFFSLLLLLIPGFVHGQKAFTIVNIPDSLKENANVVYFIDEATFEIVDDSKAVYKSHTVAAILNSNGKKHATQYVGYDKLRKINSFTGMAYDENGNEITKLKKSDIVDQSNISGFSLYEDNRVQYADLKQNEYPYIVKFHYEVESKYTYSIPSWPVLSGENASVVLSSYKIIFPKDLKPNTKLINTNEELEITEVDGKIEILFEMKNVKAIEHESNSPPANELYPILYATSSKFNFEGYQGSFNSWEEM